MCHWFESSTLPFVFGILLFLVKMVRAINDNVAPMFYNATHSITSYFFLGLIVTIASLWCAHYLSDLHESIIERAQEKERKFESDNQQKSDKRVKIFDQFKNLPYDYYYISVIYLFGFSAIHAFYPNMSYFFQVRFGFNNE
jgi:hypothetical protein